MDAFDAITAKYMGGSPTQSATPPQDSQAPSADTFDQITAKYMGRGPTSESSAIPNNLNSAKQDLGSQLFNGYCQAFVEQKTYGQTGMYPTAVDAWNQQLNKAKPGLDGAQPGDLVYFAPDNSNDNAGHVGIYEGGNKFISATYGGVKEEDINNWMKTTGQQLLGHISGSPNQ